MNEAEFRDRASLPSSPAERRQQRRQAEARLAVQKERSRRQRSPAIYADAPPVPKVTSKARLLAIAVEVQEAWIDLERQRSAKAVKVQTAGGE